MSDENTGENAKAEPAAGKSGPAKPAAETPKAATKPSAAAKTKTTKDEGDKLPAGHKEFKVASPIRKDGKTYKPDGPDSKIALDRHSHAALSRTGAVKGEWPGK